MSEIAFSSHAALCRAGPGGKCPFDPHGPRGVGPAREFVEAVIHGVGAVIAVSTGSGQVAPPSSLSASSSSSVAPTGAAGGAAALLPLAGTDDAGGAHAHGRGRGGSGAAGGAASVVLGGSASASSSSSVRDGDVGSLGVGGGGAPFAFRPAEEVIADGLAHCLPLDTLESPPLLITALWRGDEETALRLLAAPNPPSPRVASRDGTLPAWVTASLGMTRALDALRLVQGALSGFVDSTYRHTVLHALASDEAFLSAFTTAEGPTRPHLPADDPRRAAYLQALALADPSLLELRDAKGCTPLEHAMRHGSTRCALSLIHAGARLPSRARGEWLACERALRTAAPNGAAMAASPAARSTLRRLLTKKGAAGAVGLSLRRGVGSGEERGGGAAVDGEGEGEGEDENGGEDGGADGGGGGGGGGGGVNDDDEGGGRGHDDDEEDDEVGGGDASPPSSEDEVVRCDTQQEDAAASELSNPLFFRAWRRAKRAKQRMLRAVEKAAADQGVHWGRGSGDEAGAPLGSFYPHEQGLLVWGVVRVITLFTILFIIAVVFKQGRERAIAEKIAAGVVPGFPKAAV
jgi:hypothetical protein